MTDDDTQAATVLINKFLNIVDELSETELSTATAAAVAKVFFDSIIAVLYVFEKDYNLDVMGILKAETVKEYAERIKAESESDPEGRNNLH